MKLLTATMMASALFASPVLACEFGKTAEVKQPVQTAMINMDTAQSAMSAYDPDVKPVFEPEVEAVDSKLRLKKDESDE